MVSNSFCRYKDILNLFKIWWQKNSKKYLWPIKLCGNVSQSSFQLSTLNEPGQKQNTTFATCAHTCKPLPLSEIRIKVLDQPSNGSWHAHEVMLKKWIQTSALLESIVVGVLLQSNKRYFCNTMYNLSQANNQTETEKSLFSIGASWNVFGFSSMHPFFSMHCGIHWRAQFMLTSKRHYKNTLFYSHCGDVFAGECIGGVANQQTGLADSPEKQWRDK